VARPGTPYFKSDVLLSIIIPFHNAERSLEHCLEALQGVANHEMEVILVDDASSGRSFTIASGFPYQYIRLEKRSGPATARNRGAELAKGKFLLFLDADVVVHQDTLEKLLQTYERRPEIAAVSGIYSDRPVLPRWFQEFKAIEETSKYRSYSSDRYSSFDSHCASIRREVFSRLGGFDPRYKGADTEDADLGYRLAAKNYINCINKEARVDHYYKNFFKSLWNYCWRSFLWSRLFLKRLRFDEAVTTASNAFSVFLASGLATATVLSFWFQGLLWFAGVGLILFIVWNHGFFELVLRKTGWKILFKGPIYLFFLFMLHVAVGVGIFLGFLIWPFKDFITPFFSEEGRVRFE